MSDELDGPDGQFHPMTCGNADCRTELAPVPGGLVCPTCGYFQSFPGAMPSDRQHEPAEKTDIVTMTKEALIKEVLRLRRFIERRDS